METAQFGTAPIVVDIGSPEKPENFTNIAIVLFILLALLGTAAFGGGFVIGRATLTDNQPVLQKQAPTTKASGDNTIYTDSANRYSLTFPNDWKQQTNSDGTVGVSVNSQTASVQLWLGVEQEVGFSAEQKAAIDKTTKVDLTVNGTKITLTEYLYKAGNYFAVGKLASTSKNPPVTFFIKADDQGSYQVAKGIVSSFKFL